MRFICLFVLMLIPFAAMSDSLLWSQEFNGAKGALPEAQYWSAELGDSSSRGSGGREYYLSDAASMDGEGRLVLTSTRQTSAKYRCYYGRCEWTSARYNTLGKVVFRYGLIEARIKASTGGGAWPAFWLLGTNYSNVGWPRCGELDIGEWLGSSPRSVWGTAHWGSALGGSFSKGGMFADQSSLAADFHTYSLRWLPDEIVWLIDGQAYYTLKKNEANAADWPFDHAMFLVINLAMGGDLGGPISPSLTTSTYEIDWIRYSQVDGYGEVAFNQNMQ